MSLGIGWWIGRRGALAFARKNLERSIDDDAVVHRCPLEKSEFEDGKRMLTKKMRVMKTPAMAPRRPLGERLLKAAMAL
jgi:hypothetical protein